MERWTMQELEQTDDISFAISVLNKRRRELNPYSPLSIKLKSAEATLEKIKEATTRYLGDLAAVGCGENPQEVLEDGTDLSGCDDETKAIILDNAEKLDEMYGTDEEVAG